MAKRVVVKKGDIFEVVLENQFKKYFQLIATDKLQLNSDVIRIFKKKYDLESNFELSEIINDSIESYVHCSVKLGVKLDFWSKVGNCDNIGDIEGILFKDTNDYGRKVGDKSIKVSKNWYVWQLGDSEFNKVGVLKKENTKANIGIVINPNGILELLKGNKYPINYPS